MAPKSHNTLRGASTSRSRTPPRARVAPPVNSLAVDGGVEVELYDSQENFFRLRVLQSTRLRDVQKILVTWLGLSFPLYSAMLTKPDGDTSDDFNDEPFKDAQTGDKYTVRSELTSDMHFFDRLFRMGN